MHRYYDQRNVSVSANGPAFCLQRTPHPHWSGLPHNVRAPQMYLYGENILHGEILVFTPAWTQKYPVITLSIPGLIHCSHFLI